MQEAELVCDAPAARDGRSLLLSDSPHYRHYNASPMTPIRAASPGNYTTTVYSPAEQHMHTAQEGRGSSGLAVGGDSDAVGPSEVLEDGEATADAQDELARARARVAELEQQCYPQALVEQDQLRWAAAVALADTDGLWDREELREQHAEREHAKKARHALEMERTMRRLKAMTESARTGKTVTIYFGDGRAPLPVSGPRWLAEQPPYGTAEAGRWERRRNGLVARTAKDVRREIEAEEEHKTAEYGAWQDSDLDRDSNSSKEQEDSSSDRDTHFNPDSSPKLPAEEDRQAQAAAEVSDATGSESSDTDRDTDINLVSSPALPADSAWSRNQALFVDADRIAQAEFEEAVADGSYEADPDFEWEPEGAREGL